MTAFQLIERPRGSQMAPLFLFPNQGGPGLPIPHIWGVESASERVG